MSTQARAEQPVRELVARVPCKHAQRVLGQQPDVVRALAEKLGVPKAPLPAQLSEAALVDAVQLVEADQVVSPSSHHVANPVEAVAAAIQNIPMQQVERRAADRAAGQSSAVW